MPADFPQLSLAASPSPEDGSGMLRSGNLLGQASHHLINQDSGNVEYYTPSEIVEAARRTMGQIELDPFSSAVANERVRAAQGCCITFSATSEQWFQPLLRRPQCYLSPRTNYYMPVGSLKVGVTKGSVVTYFGHDVSAFAREFSALGVVKVAWPKRSG